MWSEPLYTAGEMRAAEESYDGPTLELMERAGNAAAEAVRSEVDVPVLAAPEAAVTRMKALVGSC